MNGALCRQQKVAPLFRFDLDESAIMEFRRYMFSNGMNVYMQRLIE